MMYKRKVFKKFLSKDTLYYLCEFIATLNGREIIDNYVVYKTCTPIRCRDDIMCTKCHKIAHFSEKEVCTSNNCIKYPISSD